MTTRLTATHRGSPRPSWAWLSELGETKWQQSVMAARRRLVQGSGGAAIDPGSRRERWLPGRERWLPCRERWLPGLAPGSGAGAALPVGSQKAKSGSSIGRHVLCRICSRRASGGPLRNISPLRNGLGARREQIRHSTCQAKHLAPAGFQCGSRPGSQRSRNREPAPGAGSQGQ